MSYQAEVKLYKQALHELLAMGYKSGLSLAAATQGGMKKGLRQYLASLEIDGPSKKILTTDQNWALTAQVIAELEDTIDMSFVKPGRDWITEVRERAYFIGSKYEAQLIKGGSVADAVILRGLDGPTLKALRSTSLDLVKKIGAEQKEYLRRALTEAVIHNRSWTDTANRVIRDGKVPALVVTDKNGVQRFIEMENRVDNLVRTETARIAEQGAHDKASEFFGDELWGRWHTILDGRERASHELRNGMMRSEKDWLTKPGPDGKVIMPGQEVNCRCSMEWGSKETITGSPSAGAAIQTAPKPIEIPAPPPPAPKPKPAPVQAAKAKQVPGADGKYPPITSQEDFAERLVNMGLAAEPDRVNVPNLTIKGLNEVGDGLAEAQKRFPMKLSSFYDNGPHQPDWVVKGVGNANACTWPQTGEIALNAGYVNNWTAPEYVYRLQHYMDEVANRVINDAKKALDYWKALDPSKHLMTEAQYARKVKAFQKEYEATLHLYRWSVSAVENRVRPFSTAIHEYGHQVQAKMTQAHQLEFKKAWRKVGTGEHYKVSHYAHDKWQEGWAECFAAWMQGEEIDSDLYRAFLKIIKEVEATWEPNYSYFNAL